MIAIKPVKTVTLYELIKNNANLENILYFCNRLNLAASYICAPKSVYLLDEYLISTKSKQLKARFVPSVEIIFKKTDIFFKSITSFKLIIIRS